MKVRLRFCATITPTWLTFMNMVDVYENIELYDFFDFLLLSRYFLFLARGWQIYISAGESTRKDQLAVSYYPNVGT